MYSLDMMVAPMCQVDLLHATVDVNGMFPDRNRFISYQTLVVESEVAGLVHQSSNAALVVSQSGLASAGRIRLSPQLFGLRELHAAQHHTFSRYVPGGMRNGKHR